MTEAEHIAKARDISLEAAQMILINLRVAERAQERNDKRIRAFARRQHRGLA